MSYSMCEMLDVKSSVHFDILRESLIELSAREEYWDVTCHCSDGELSIARLILGLVFPQITDQTTVILPDFSVSEVLDLSKFTISTVENYKMKGDLHTASQSSNFKEGLSEVRRLARSFQSSGQLLGRADTPSIPGDCKEDIFQGYSTNYQLTDEGGEAYLEGEEENEMPEHLYLEDLKEENEMPEHLYLEDLVNPHQIQPLLLGHRTNSELPLKVRKQDLKKGKHQFNTGCGYPFNTGYYPTEVDVELEEDSSWLEEKYKDDIKRVDILVAKLKPSSALSSQIRTIKKQKCLKSLQRRNKRCKRCRNCIVPDCLECAKCLDMKKYGGPQKLKQACRMRPRCLKFES